ncbi:hypothetical protein ACLOJK_035369 [Asimina triloba]
MDVSDVGMILRMTPNDWEDTVSHAVTCIPSEPIYQQFNPCISQAAEVVQQQTVQAVYEQHEVVGVSSNVRINSLSRGSSDPGFQNGFCLNCQQFGGFHGAKSPAVAMSPFLNRFQEDRGYIIRSEDYEIPEQGFDFESILQEPADVSFADGFLSMPTESTAGKHEAPLKWSTLIAAMAFSVRIVAVSGMQNNILDGKSPPGPDLYELTARVLSRSLCSPLKQTKTGMPSEMEVVFVDLKCSNGIYYK